MAKDSEDQVRKPGSGAFYPSTTLRVVPLPIFDGEDFS
jgi:hypothetical protein